MKHSSIFSTKLLLAAVPLLLSVGCAMFSHTTHRRASSVVEYLYPKDSKHIDEPSVPVLSLPLKVGIAFVPDANQQTCGGTFISSAAAPFTEKQKIALMKEVSDN